MLPLSIHKLRDSSVVTTVLYFFSLVLRIQATPMFSPDLFHNAEGSKCPPNANKRAAMCTFKLNAFKEGGWKHKKILEDRCENGDFLDAVNCIERVSLNCRHDNTDEAFLLRSNVDVRKVRSSVTYFCDHIDTYTSQFDCMESSEQELTTCASEAFKTFKSQHNATSNRDVMLRFQCPLFNKLVLCQESIFKKNCGKTLSNLVFKVMVGFEPPICKETSYNFGHINVETLGQNDEDMPGYSAGQRRQRDGVPDPGNSGLTILSWSSLSVLMSLSLFFVL